MPVRSACDVTAPSARRTQSRRKLSASRRSPTGPPAACRAVAPRGAKAGTRRRLRQSKAVDSLRLWPKRLILLPLHVLGGAITGRRELVLYPTRKEANDAIVIMVEGRRIIPRFCAAPHTAARAARGGGGAARWWRRVFGLASTFGVGQCWQGKHRLLPPWSRPARCGVATSHARAAGFRAR